MAHAQKPDFFFWRNGRVHLNRQGRQFSRLLAAEVCASAVVIVVMLDTPCSEVVWRLLATLSICQFPLHFPPCASQCAITFQLDCTTVEGGSVPPSSWWQRFRQCSSEITVCTNPTTSSDNAGSYTEDISCNVLVLLSWNFLTFFL